MKTVNFDNLIGSEATLYQCTVDQYTFQLGTVVFQVMEDEEDGYRSSMSEVQILKTKSDRAAELDTIAISKKDEIYYLTSIATGHVWLRFGTDDSDNYYPCFIFEWSAFDEEAYISKLKDLIL